MIRLRADCMTVDEARRFVEGADAVDADGMPVRVSVRFRPDGTGGSSGSAPAEGWIEVAVAPLPGSPRAPSVSLRGLAPAGAVGALSQMTCLVEPEADGLSFAIEAARSRLKDFLRIGEDWQFFDDDGAQDAIAQFDRARHAFTAAVLAGEAGARVSHARRSLELAIDAGERLATSYASRTIARRTPKSPPLLASTADVGEASDASIQAALAAAQRSGEGLRVVLPPPPAKDGTPFDSKAAIACLAGVDRWLVAAFKARVPVMIGPLWHAATAVAGRSAAQWRSELDAWIEVVVRRYGSGVADWIIATDAERSAESGLSVDERAMLIRHAANRVRSLLPRGRIYVESTVPWGDGLRLPGGVPLVRFLHRLADEGMPLHGVLLGVGPSQRSPQRDLLQVAGLLDKLRPVKIPLFCTMGISPPDGPDAAARGWWRKQWATDVAAAFASRAAAIALARPWVHGFIWDGRPPGLPWAAVAEPVRSVRRRLMMQVAAAPEGGAPTDAGA